MRDYIPKYLNPHKYRKALAAYQGYDDMLEEIEELKDLEAEIIFASPKYRDVICSEHVSKPTESKAIELEQKRTRAAFVIKENERQTKAVEQALNCFDEQIQEMLSLSIRFGVRYCDMPGHGINMSIRTMERRKREFVNRLAENLCLI